MTSTTTTIEKPIYSRIAYQWAGDISLNGRTDMLYGMLGRAVCGRLNHGQLCIARALVQRALDDSAACTDETSGRYEIRSHAAFAAQLGAEIEANYKRTGR